MVIRLPCLLSIVYSLGGFMSNTFKLVLKNIIRGIIIAVVIFICWKIWG